MGYDRELNLLPCVATIHSVDEKKREREKSENVNQSFICCVSVNAMFSSECQSFEIPKHTSVRSTLG